MQTTTRLDTFRLIVQELMNFSQLLGYSEIAYRSDNEPTTRQVLKMLVTAYKTEHLKIERPFISVREYS